MSSVVRVAGAWLTLGLLWIVLVGVSALLVLLSWGVGFEGGKGVRPNGAYEPFPFIEFPLLATAALTGAQGLLVVAALTLVVVLKASTIVKIVGLVGATVGAVVLYLAYIAAMSYI